SEGCAHLETRAGHARGGERGAKLGGGASLADHFDADLERPARHRRAKERVGRDREAVGIAELLLHRSKRDRHEHASRGRVKAPIVGEVRGEPTRGALEPLDGGVAREIGGRTRHDVPSTPSAPRLWQWNSRMATVPGVTWL